MGVVGADTGPLAWHPLVAHVAIDVQAVLVLGGQFLEVGTVLAEPFGHAEVGPQQGGIEGPVQGFDVGVAPLAVVVAQALATEFQLLARVGGQAAVANPELAHGQVAFLGFAVTAVGLLGAAIGLLQGVGLDDVAGRHGLGHGIGAPGAAFAFTVDPWTQVQADTVDVATALGAEVTVIFGLSGDLHFQAEILAIGQCRQGRTGPQQGKRQANTSLHKRVELQKLHRGSSPSSSFRACSSSVSGLIAPRMACSCCSRRWACASCSGGNCASRVWASSVACGVFCTLAN